MISHENDQSSLRLKRPREYLRLIDSQPDDEPREQAKGSTTSLIDPQLKMIQAGRAKTGLTQVSRPRADQFRSIGGTLVRKRSQQNAKFSMGTT